MVWKCLNKRKKSSKTSERSKRVNQKNTAIYLASQRNVHNPSNFYDASYSSYYNPSLYRTRLSTPLSITSSSNLMKPNYLYDKRAVSQCLSKSKVKRTLQMRVKRIKVSWTLFFLCFSYIFNFYVLFAYLQLVDLHFHTKVYLLVLVLSIFMKSKFFLIKCFKAKEAWKKSKQQVELNSFKRKPNASSVQWLPHSILSHSVSLVLTLFVYTFFIFRLVT